MGNYVLGIVGASAVIGIMEAILPKNSKTRLYVKLITSLCLLCLVIRPVGTVLRDLPDLLLGKIEEMTIEGEQENQEYGAILDGQIEETVKEQLELAIREILREKFSVRSCDVGTVLQKRDGAWKVVRVAITLTGKDIFRNPYTIEEAVSQLLDCECTVATG